MQAKLNVYARCFQPRQWFLDGCSNYDEELCGDQLMWVYRASEDSRWIVGFYTPVGEWVNDSIHDTPAAAASRVRWLNGGS